jgi:hypothetical protein
LVLSTEQTTIELESLSEIFRIKLKAFLPSLFKEHHEETLSDVVAAPICAPTREYGNMWSCEEIQLVG